MRAKDLLTHDAGGVLRPRSQYYAALSASQHRKNLTPRWYARFGIITALAAAVVLGSMVVFFYFQ